MLTDEQKKYEFVLDDIEGNQKKWVAALRSGLWWQGEDYLRLNDGFCCLGVAASLTPGSEESRVELSNGVNAYFGLTDCCPKKTMKYLGLLSKQGDFRGGMIPSLMDLNDSRVSFKKIAQIIEDNNDKLFKEVK